MHPSLYERDMDLFRTHEKGKASLFPVTKLCMARVLTSMVTQPAGGKGHVSSTRLYGCGVAPSLGAK